MSKPSSVSKIKVGNNKITPYWHRQTSSANTSGYEIAYKKAGSNHYSYKYASGCDTSHKTIKVGNHKRYYVKVRVYKTLSGKKYYSTWTGTKKSAYTK
ncbi:MAG: hypothetical protein LBL67_02390 [Coriobacteriales bacterium]|nr:hypothetical protein [Coriobacteriales bacterium]